MAGQITMGCASNCFGIVVEIAFFEKIAFCLSELVLFEKCLALEVVKLFDGLVHGRCGKV